MSKSFEDLLSKVSECEMKKVAVAVAQDSAVLEAVAAAKERGIAEAILVGDADKIKEVAEADKVDISGFEIIDEKDNYEAALKAVNLVHEGKADMYMKGLIDTKSFLKSVLDKEVGLRTGKALSHVCVFEVEGIDHLLFLTDVAFMTYPTLEDKVHIIENTVDVCHACGIPNPKVAPLAAVEVVNPKMPVTVEADELTKMCEEGKSPAVLWMVPFRWIWRSTPRRRSIKARKAEKSWAMRMCCSSPTSMRATSFTSVWYIRQR